MLGIQKYNLDGGEACLSRIFYDTFDKHTEINTKILKDDIMSVLRLDSGYTIKYNPSPLEFHFGFALGNTLTPKATNTDTKYLQTLDIV